MKLAQDYAAAHVPAPQCPYYWNRKHYFAPGGMDARGLLARANDEWDVTNGQLFRCSCGAAKIGPDPDTPAEPPHEHVLDPRTCCITDKIGKSREEARTWRTMKQSRF